MNRREEAAVTVKHNPVPPNTGGCVCVCVRCQEDPAWALAEADRANTNRALQTTACFQLGDEVLTPTGYRGVVEYVGSCLIAVRYRVHRRNRSAWWPAPKLTRLGTKSKRNDLDE